MKVVIITYYFKPLNIVGAYRPKNWASELAALGHTVTVVTKNWHQQNQSTTEQTEFEVIHSESGQSFFEKATEKTYTFWNPSRYRRKWIAFLNRISYKPWKRNFKNLYVDCREHIRKNGADFIIATGEPFATFGIADKLHREFGTSWIADYRDGWSTNYSFDYFNSPIQAALKRIIEHQEKRIVKSAIGLTTVSDDLASRISLIFPSKRIQIIVNGYIKSVIDAAIESKSKKVKDSFKVVYAGRIYPYQRVDVFMSGFCQWLEKAPKKDEIELIFIGLNQGEIHRIESAIKPNLAVVTFIPKLSHSESLAKLASADLLLIFANENIDGSCSKIYEYLPLGNHILLTVNDHGTLEQLISSAPKGYIAHNSDEVLSTLEKIYHKTREASSEEQTQTPYLHYSASAQTKKLEEFLIRLSST